MDSKEKYLPLLALRGLTILPDMIVHFDVNRKKSIAALEKAMLDDQMIFLVSQRLANTEDPGFDDLNTVGTVARIKQLLKLPQNVVRVLVEGLSRGHLLAVDETDGALFGKIYEPERIEDEEDIYKKQAAIRTAHELLELYFHENSKMGKESIQKMLEIKEVGKLADQIAANIQFLQEEKQLVLDEVLPLKRLTVALELVYNEIEVIKIKKDLQGRVKERIDKNQKDYFLREQLKVIHEELGDTSSLDDAEQYIERIKKLKVSKDIKERIKKEVHKFKKLPNGSAEASVLRTYIETLLELPWDKESKERKDINSAQAVLNQDHYGLEKVKERILEHLAVRIKTQKGEGSILCLLGPPGTGKTSIAKSIARAMEREFARISLGGVRDEAEIRGHRKTYVGAMPGRIIAAIKRTGVKNPVILLDEIDKMSSDFKGDPSAALLEVLDKEQNSQFRDHYIELPIDLSNVMFIATANSYQTIPAPLLDRMELIEVASYTENEKIHIANDYLIHKQLTKHGLEQTQLEISKKVLACIIQDYTREAGVRTLERRLGDICRKVVREILTETDKKVRLTEKNLTKYLGPAKYHYQMANEKDEVGIVRGLAWTRVGGDTLSIEVNVMQGKGKIELTGKLGEVMKESARTAISYIRTKAAALSIEAEAFDKNDIHIHIPEGAVPKDGPSAGITMATAIISALTNKPVDARLAMTGEITLRGRVLPIGGLKEKVIAAKRAGIKTVLIPQNNERDLLEMPKEVIQGIKIVPVSSMDQVIKIVFDI